MTKTKSAHGAAVQVKECMTAQLAVSATALALSLLRKKRMTVMKQALQALIFEMEYVLSCINEDKIPFDGDDFHEALRLGKEALAKQEQGKSVIGMLEPIGILMKLEGDKHLKIYGMDEQLEQQSVATEEKWDGTLHKGIIHSEKLITSQPKQEQGEPVAKMTAHRAAYFMERFKLEEKLLGPNEKAAVDFVIDMLNTTPQPAQKPLMLEKFR